MKIPSLIATAVLALGMAAGAAAQVAPAAAAPTEVEHCEPAAATGCAASDEHVATEGQAASAKVDEAPLPVPEPETSIMLMLGLVVLGVASRRSVSERFDR